MNFYNFILYLTVEFKSYAILINKITMNNETATSCVCECPSVYVYVYVYVCVHVTAYSYNILQYIHICMYACIVLLLCPSIMCNVYH